jgi:hypothetical protein
MDFRQWQGELVAPPLKGCLRLCDSLPPEVQEEFGGVKRSFASMLAYSWFCEENYKRADRWVRTLPLTRGRSDKADKFLHRALSDIYDRDRALRAGDVMHKEPVLRKDIPDELIRAEPAPVADAVRAVGSGNPLSQTFITYDLVVKEFEYEVGTPPEAVDAVARLLEVELPDRLWIAEYEERRKTWDPIIYAEYGEWQVEVARWE